MYIKQSNEYFNSHAINKLLVWSFGQLGGFL